MRPLTSDDIRASFINASKREAALAASAARLDGVAWERLDIFGWTDPKNPLVTSVVIPVDDVPLGILLRTSTTKPKKTMCALCEDIIAVDDVRLFVARLAGPAGRRGDSVGTLLHTNVQCSVHVRRQPNTMEGKADPEGFIARRVGVLQTNAERFARRVRGS